MGFAFLWLLAPIYADIADDCITLSICHDQSIDALLDGTLPSISKVDTFLEGAMYGPPLDLSLQSLVW